MVDAPTVHAKPAFRDVAQAVGLPFLIDPVTRQLLDVQSRNDSWPRSTSRIPRQLAGARMRMVDEVIDRTLRFQQPHAPGRREIAGAGLNRGEDSDFQDYATCHPVGARRRSRSHTEENPLHPERVRFDGS